MKTSVSSYTQQGSFRTSVRTSYAAHETYKVISIFIDEYLYPFRNHDYMKNEAMRFHWIVTSRVVATTRLPTQAPMYSGTNACWRSRTHARTQAPMH